MSKHSFSLSLEEEDYKALAELAQREDRHIYEQARHLLRRELKRLSGAEEPLNGPVMYEKRILTEVPHADGTSTITFGDSDAAGAVEEALPDKQEPQPG